MATYKPAAHIADIRGHIQNTTYSRNRLGNYLKTRKGPLDRRTLPQLTQRAYLKTAIYLWTSLLAASDRTAWNNLALLTTFMNAAGIQYHPTGYNLFLRVALFQMSIGSAPSVHPPNNAASPASTFVIVATHGANIVIASDGGFATGKTGATRFYISPRLKPSRFSWTGPWEQSPHFTLAAIAAGLPNFVIAATPTSSAGDRIYITTRSFYLDGAGHTLTWPQFIPVQIA
jgi:hypothetical protein